MNNLFIVKSPLQMINAIESISYFNLENNILITLNDGTINNTLQIEKMTSLYAWKKVLTIKDNRKSKFFKYIKLINQLRKDTYNYIFVGEFSTINKIILANTIKNKVFYYDDGVLTLSDYKNRILPNKINKYDYRELRFLLFGFSIKVIDKINMFSYFDLELSERIIVKNNFSYFKENYLGHLKKTNDIYFLGQPFYILDSLDIYIRFITSIIKKYPKRKIIYMPHRAETKDQIKRIKELESDLFEFRKNILPIELYFMEIKTLPDTVISFRSSALDTLKLIYNISNILSIETPKSMIKNKVDYDTSLKIYYESLQSNQIIKFKDIEF